MGDEDITQIVEPGSLPLDFESKPTDPNLPKIDPPKEDPSTREKLTAAADKAIEFAKENPKKVIAVGVVALALGAALSGGPSEPKGEPPHVQVAISEHFKTPVRFTGAPLKPKAERVQTVFGEAVVYESIPQEATCLVVFEAREKKVGQRTRPALTFPSWWMSPGSDPDPLPGTSAGGSALFMATFQGNGCLAIADREEFIGSDIHQLILHPKGRKLLWQKAKAGAKDGEDKPVPVVPFLDPQAVGDGEAWFPYELAGRPDMNFAKADGVHPRKRKEQE
jgi:hypothetical protein